MSPIAEEQTILIPKISTPIWLTDQFLEKHLQNHYKNSKIRVIDYSVKPPSNDGNFVSNIYRVHVEFDTTTAAASKDDMQSKQSEGHFSLSDLQHSNVDLIIKESISNEFVLNAFRQYDVYRKEMEFYEKIVPKFNEKLKELGERELMAEPFGICTDRNILILEDLSTKGYQARSPLHGFDMHEAKAVLKRVATFHAIGAVLQEQQSDIFENFKLGHISTGADGCDTTYKSHFDDVIDSISKWPGFEGYANKMRRIRHELIERAHQAYDVNPDHFNTLVHDDLWSTNLMIKPAKTNDIEKPFENLIFIDFQFSFWSTPTIDLHHFLNTALCDSLRPHHLDELVQFYYEHLADRLKRLNFHKKIPTWPEFFAQYQERHFFGFMISCLVQPLHINNTVKIDIETLILDNEENLQTRRNLYKNERVLANLKKLIPHYDQLGVFD